MRRGFLSREAPARSPGRNGGRPAAYDRHWAARTRTAVAAATGVLTLTLVLDGCAGSLTLPRAALWTALAGLLLGVLLPSRTTAGPGWLAVRGLFHRQRVRTDLLVAATLDGAIDRRLLLRDAFGARAEVDPRVLAASPFLWHELDRAARRSHAAGLLPDTHPLDVLADEIDAAGARRLLETAGLDA